MASKLMKQRLAGGREAEYTLEEWKLEDLRYDPRNPRLAHEWQQLGEDEELSQEEIAKYLDNIKNRKLYRGVVEALGITERLQIRPNGTVFEGNNRLWVLREIKKNLETKTGFSSLEQDKLSKLVQAVPVKVFKDLGPVERDSLLLEYHVAGKNQWPAFNQASHLHKLYSDSGMSIEEIATMMRKGKTYVAQKIKAFEWLTAHRERYPADDIKKFSFYEEAYKVRKRLADAGLDLDTSKGMQLFQDRIHDGTITRAHDIRDLPVLLSRSESRKEFLEGDAAAIMQDFRDSDPSKFSQRFKAMQTLKTKLENIQISDYKKIKDDERYEKYVLDLAKDLEQLVKEAKAWKT